MKYIFILLFLVITGCQCNSKRGSEPIPQNKTEADDNTKQQFLEKNSQQGVKTKGQIYGSDKSHLSDTASEAPKPH
jgi:hypothetical protein